MLTRHNTILAAALPKLAAKKSSRTRLGLTLGIIAAGSLSSAIATPATTNPDFFWRGGDGVWNNTANWAQSAGGSTAYNPANYGVASFNTTAASNTSQTVTYNLPSWSTINGVEFNSAGSTTLIGTAGSELKLYKSITVNSGAGAVTIGSNESGKQLNINLNNEANTWTNNSANGLNIVNNVKIGDWSKLTVQGSGNTTVQGVVSQAEARNNNIWTPDNNENGLLKTGSGTLTLNGANTYKGYTEVKGGTLSINGDSSAATGNMSVSGAGTALTGNGTVGGNTTLSNGATHSAGGIGTVGLQTFDKAGAATTNLSYGSGSIFSWTLDSALAQTRGVGYDAVNVTGNLTGSADAIFQVDIGSGSFTDTFWDTARSWDDIFMGSNGAKADWTSIFGGGLRSADTLGQGSFSFSGNSLVWNPVYSPVPEPTSALAGLLLVAGILRRRRNA